MRDALRRAMRTEIPVVVVLVDPKDEAVAQGYGRFGFQHLTPDRMVVTVLKLESRFTSSFIA